MFCIYFPAKPPPHDLTYIYDRWGMFHISTDVCIAHMVGHVLLNKVSILSQSDINKMIKNSALNFFSYLHIAKTTFTFMAVLGSVDLVFLQNTRLIHPIPPK